MSEVSERLDAIAARAADCQTYNFGLRNADQLAHSDVPYLLALVNKQADALARVEFLAGRWQEDFPHKTSLIRAALKETS